MIDFGGLLDSLLFLSTVVFLGGFSITCGYGLWVLVSLENPRRRSRPAPKALQ
jgi:hypothetical protein